MFRWRYIVGTLFLLLLVIGGLTLAFAPWKSWLEKQLLTTLHQQGFSDASFRLGRLGISGVVLKDIRFGETLPITFDDATVSYSLADLRAHRLRAITLHGIHYAVADAGLRLNAEKVELTLAQQSVTGAWSGEWKLSNLQSIGMPVAIPPLAGSGTFTIRNDRVRIEGNIQSGDRAYQSAFTLTKPLSGTASGAIELALSAPWQNGVVRIPRTVISLAPNHRIAVAVRFEHVPLAPLMETLTGGKAQGTGSVSGMVPILYKPDGSLHLADNKGGLSADAPGTILLTPDTIPGDSPQIAFVRDILKNLHYEVLSMSLENTEGNRFRLGLTVEGSNPDMVPPRPVKLNVQFNGDLLQLVTQNLMPLTDPKTLLEQDPK